MVDARNFFYDERVGIDVRIDRDACMGSGNCVYEAVGVFDLDDDGVAAVVDIDAAPEATIVSAAHHCPASAISVTRDGEPLN